MPAYVMLALATLCSGSSHAAVAQVAASAEVRLAGDWTVSVTVPGSPPITAALSVPGPDIVTVTQERHDQLPVFDPKAAGWKDVYGHTLFADSLMALFPSRP